LAVVDVADPTAPAMVGHLDTPSMGYGVAMAGNRAVLASYDAGIYVVDIADPADPQVLGTLPTPDAALAVEVQGSHAYVAVDWAGLLVADISDPLAPAAVTTLPLAGRARNVALATDHAYVAAGLNGGLQAIAIDDPTAPVGALEQFDPRFTRTEIQIFPGADFSLGHPLPGGRGCTCTQQHHGQHQAQ